MMTSMRRLEYLALVMFPAGIVTVFPLSRKYLGLSKYVIPPYMSSEHL